MAGAVSQFLSDDVARVVAAPSWAGSRAHTALVQVLRLLPLDVRAHAACVCRSWRDAAADPTLWLALRFDDGFSLELSNATFALLCARAGAALRELRLDSPSCRAVTADGVIAALRAGGCAGVQRLTFSATLRPDRGSRRLSAAQVQQLATACPALQHAACSVRCLSATDVATACALPGPLSVFVYHELDAARAALQLPAQIAELEILACSLKAACDALREALLTNTTLTELRLVCTGIGDAGAAALGDALRTNATLSTLELGSGNNIRGAGAVALANALRTNTTLTTLALHGNCISDAGAAAVLKSLRSNTAITTLTLGGNDISVAGATALADALRTNTTLATLHLRGQGGIGSARAAALGEVMRTNTTLRTLKYNTRVLILDGLLQDQTKRRPASTAST